MFPNPADLHRSAEPTKEQIQAILDDILSDGKRMWNDDGTLERIAYNIQGVWSEPVITAITRALEKDWEVRYVADHPELAWLDLLPRKK